MAKWWLNIFKHTEISTFSKTMLGFFNYENKFYIISFSTCALGGGIVYMFFDKAPRADKVKDSSEPTGSHRVDFSRLKVRLLSKKENLNARERRFMKFASVEYDGQLYMTPKDFIDAVVIQEPRPRLKRKQLSDEDTQKIRDAVLNFKSMNQTKRSNQMFHTLHDTGILSYTEYMFLLSVLTRPQAGYQIAFNMFDRDGNAQIDKNEFLEMEHVFSNVLKAKRKLSEQKKISLAKEKIDSTETNKSHSHMDGESGLEMKHSVDTTLHTYFFGKEGNELLSFEAFVEFMTNLRTEVLESEFNEFAKGYDTISEVDFIKALVRYTLPISQDNIFVKRILENLEEEKGITFEEFYLFCRFLNHLNDFVMAIRMFKLIDENISEDTFHRIVNICASKQVSSYVMRVVYTAFDPNGDGKMNYREFLRVMKNRQSRLFKYISKTDYWRVFKSCMREEMK